MLDRVHAAALADRLRSAGYTLEEVTDRLGAEATDALARNTTLAARNALGDAADAQAALVRMFLLHYTVSPDAAGAALGDLGPLEEAGIVAATSDGVRAGLEVRPYAAAGAGVDLMVGGLTLGAAALAGAIAGGALQTARSYGSRLLGKLKGQRELTVDDSVLRLLALRQRQLLHALNARGHAAVDSIKVATPQDKTWREGKLPEALNKARAHPQWSSLNPHAKLSQAERQEQIELLVEQI